MCADSTSIDKTCRFCKENVFVNGRFCNVRSIFGRPATASEKSLSERFLDVGITLAQIPGYSGRICGKCFRKFRGVEDALALLNTWKEDHHNHTSDPSTNDGKKRLRDTPVKPRTPPPIETPPKKKLLCQRVNPGSRVSLTEVYITYPSKPKPERYRCDAGISGVINHLAKGNFTTAARLMVQHDDLMADLKHVIEAVIDEECQHLCRRREGFMLWKSSPEELKNFSLDNLREDLERMAPFMFSLFCTISGMKTNHACAAAAIALRGRENHLSAFAYYVNTVLKYGGAKKAAFECLSKLGITTTHGNSVLKQHALSELCGAQVHKLNAHIENGCTLEESIGEPSTPYASIEIEVDISESEESDLGLD